MKPFFVASMPFNSASFVATLATAGRRSNSESRVLDGQNVESQVYISWSWPKMPNHKFQSAKMSNHEF
jgi:hypothetical protein